MSPKSPDHRRCAYSSLLGAFFSCPPLGFTGLKQGASPNRRVYCGVDPHAGSSQQHKGRKKDGVRRGGRTNDTPTLGSQQGGRWERERGGKGDDRDNPHADGKPTETHRHRKDKLDQGWLAKHNSHSTLLPPPPGKHTAAHRTLPPEISSTTKQTTINNRTRLQEKCHN